MFYFYLLIYCDIDVLDDIEKYVKANPTNPFHSNEWNIMIDSLSSKLGVKRSVLEMGIMTSYSVTSFSNILTLISQVKEARSLIPKVIGLQEQLNNLKTSITTILGQVSQERIKATELIALIESAQKEEAIKKAEMRRITDNTIIELNNSFNEEKKKLELELADLENTTATMQGFYKANSALNGEW